MAAIRTFETSAARAATSGASDQPANTLRCSARPVAIRPRSRSSHGWTGRSTAPTASGRTQRADSSSGLIRRGSDTTRPAPAQGAGLVDISTGYAMAGRLGPLTGERRRSARPSPTSRPGAGRLDSLSLHIGSKAAGFISCGTGCVPNRRAGAVGRTDADAGRRLDAARPRRSIGVSRRVRPGRRPGRPRREGLRG